MAVQCGEFDIGRSGSRNCILDEFVDWGKWTCCHFVVVQRFCQSERLAGSRTGGPTPRLCGRLVGWVNARAYFRTVAREVPSCRAISRRGSPWILACCTAFRAPVGEETAPCPRGQRPFSTTADELVVIFHDGIGLQDREVSQLGLAERWLPRRFTMRPILGWVPRLRGKRAAHRVGVALVDMG